MYITIPRATSNTYLGIIIFHSFHHVSHALYSLVHAPLTRLFLSVGVDAQSVFGPVLLLRCPARLLLAPQVSPRVLYRTLAITNLTTSRFVPNA